MAPPISCTRSPVAVTTRSAGSSAPERSRIPVSVNVSMWSVTTLARPPRSASNRSSSGTMHRRWSHGSYAGVKWGAVGTASPSAFATPATISFFACAGNRRQYA